MYSRGYLESLKMGELRRIGAPIGATDTSKSELIEEILEKQPRPKGLTETEKLISELSQCAGDTMSTYELRDRIMEALTRLNKLERRK